MCLSWMCWSLLFSALSLGGLLSRGCRCFAEGFRDSFSDLTLELADKFYWGLAGSTNLAQDMLRVDTGGFTGLAEVDVAADGALVADSLDRRGLATVTGHPLVFHAHLLLVSRPGRRIHDLRELLLKEALNLLRDKFLQGIHIDSLDRDDLLAALLTLSLLLLLFAVLFIFSL